MPSVYTQVMKNFSVGEWEGPAVARSRWGLCPMGTAISCPFRRGLGEEIGGCVLQFEETMLSVSLHLTLVCLVSVVLGRWFGLILIW